MHFWGSQKYRTACTEARATAQAKYPPYCQRERAGGKTTDNTARVVASCRADDSKSRRQREKPNKVGSVLSPLPHIPPMSLQTRICSLPRSSPHKRKKRAAWTDRTGPDGTGRDRTLIPSQSFARSFHRRQADRREKRRKKHGTALTRPSTTRLPTMPHPTIDPPFQRKQNTLITHARIRILSRN